MRLFARRKIGANFLARLGIAVIQYHRAAIGLGAFYFASRAVFWHHNCGLQTAAGRGPRNTLGMVAAGKGDHMFARIIKAPDSVAGTAQLERSGML